MLLQGKRCAFAKCKIISGLACLLLLALERGGGGGFDVVGGAFEGINTIMRSVVGMVALASVYVCFWHVCRERCGGRGGGGRSFCGIVKSGKGCHVAPEEWWRAGFVE